MQESELTETIPLAHTPAIQVQYPVLSFPILSLLRVHHCRGHGCRGWGLGSPLDSILSSLRARCQSVVAWGLQHPWLTDTAGNIFWLTGSSRTGRTKGRNLTEIEVVSRSEDTYRTTVNIDHRGAWRDGPDSFWGVEIRIRKKTTITGHPLCSQHCGRGFWSSCRLGTKQLSCQVLSLGSRNIWCYCTGSLS